MIEQSEEFLFSLTVIGGIILSGLMLTICLTFLGIAVYKKKKETKLNLNGKERQNGQHTTRGK